jgi:hypothetical protein
MVQKKFSAFPQVVQRHGHMLWQPVLKVGVGIGDPSSKALTFFL